MAAKAMVFVEGNSDKRFIDCLLTDLDLSEIVNTEIIGGSVAALDKVSEQIRQSSDAGLRVAVVLDADSSPKSRQEELRQVLDSLKVDVTSSFLIPNNSDSGCLETLLEQLVAAKHRAVMNCFEQYKSCLAELAGRYEPPPGKDKIYAYCEAVGDLPQPRRRNYLNRDYWNLDSPAIKPLKKFLSALAGDSADPNLLPDSETGG